MIRRQGVSWILKIGSMRAWWGIGRLSIFIGNSGQPGIACVFDYTLPWRRNDWPTGDE